MIAHATAAVSSIEQTFTPCSDPVLVFTVLKSQPQSIAAHSLAEDLLYCVNTQNNQFTRNCKTSIRNFPVFCVLTFSIVAVFSMV